MCFRDLLEPAFNSRDVKQVRQLASREALQGWSGCGSWSGTAAGRWQYTMGRFLSDERTPELGSAGRAGQPGRQGEQRKDFLEPGEPEAWVMYPAGEPNDLRQLWASRSLES